MVKKISAIFLALILCLSVMVVPVSAGVTLGDAKVAYEIKLDKKYYSAGETVTVQVFLYGPEDYYFGGGAIVIGCHSDVFAQSDNAPADVKNSASSSDTLKTYYKDASKVTWGWQTNASIYNNITTNNTAEENEKFDQYIKFLLQKSSDTSEKSVSCSAINADSNNGVPSVIFQLKLRDDIPDDTAINIGVPTGPMAKSYTYITYTDAEGVAPPSTAKTTKNDSVVTWAIATKGIEPCAPEDHVWNNGEVTENETCGKDGVKTYTCSVCKSTYTEAIPATGNHTDGEVKEIITLEPTCKVAGTKDVITYCSVCGKESKRQENVAIDPTGEHNYVEKERVEPECEKDGYILKACGCGEELEPEVLTKLGHDMNRPVADASEPTCTVPGATATVGCTRCDYTEGGAEIAAPGHDYDKVTTDPTCTEGGYTTYTCKNCPDTYVGDETTELGHDYVGEVTKVPGCANKGIMKYTCSRCKKSYKEDIPATNHKYEDGTSALEVIPAVEPTCTEQGYTEGEKCKLCNTQTVVPQGIPSTGHTKDPNNAVVVEPTYTTQGYTEYTCHCGVTFKDDYVPVKEANFSVTIKQPSITKIRCKDTIVLHTTIEGGDTNGLTVVWTADNENFVMTDLGDGKLEITSAENGLTVFTATVYDAAGNAVATDTVEMNSKADIWGKIGGFFRALFGSTLYYNY